MDLYVCHGHVWGGTMCRFNDRAAWNTFFPCFLSIALALLHIPLHPLLLATNHQARAWVSTRAHATSHTGGELPYTSKITLCVYVCVCILISMHRIVELSRGCINKRNQTYTHFSPLLFFFLFYPHVLSVER